MAASLSSKATWLKTAIAELLASPHIHFRAPVGLGIRLGPGPIDLFSTKFNNDFTPDVTAVVAGQQVDREGLKEKLLGLQQHYSADNAKFVIDGTGMTSSDPNEVRVSFTGQAQDVGDYKVDIDADVIETGGANRISSIKLEGKPELFEKKSPSEQPKSEL